METAAEKLQKLASDLKQARHDAEQQPHQGEFLGVGATIDIPDGDNYRPMSVYARNFGDNGVQINFFDENSQLLPDATTTYRTTEAGIELHEAPESGEYSVATLVRSREFGRRALYFLSNYKPGDILPEAFDYKQNKARLTVKFIDDVFRHAISQTATYKLVDDDSMQIDIYQTGKRLPVKDFDKSLPGHGHAPEFFIKNVYKTNPIGRRVLPSGLECNIFSSTGGEYEGEAFVTVADTLENLANPELYPDGPLVRMHSACCFSKVGRAPEHFYSDELEYLHANLRAYTTGNHLDLSEAAWQVIPPWKYKEPATDCCDCDEQIEVFSDLMSQEGGILAEFVQQEGRGYGLRVKEEFFYQLYQQYGEDWNTADICKKYNINPDIREYSAFARNLRRGGITKAQLVSNNPRKIKALQLAGIQVTPVSICIPTPGSREYLRTKRDKLGHKGIPSDLILDELIATKNAILIKGNEWRQVSSPGRRQTQTI